MNILTGAGVLEENRVFSTLDTKLKRLYSVREKEILVSDTVGFIRKLPHVLVASFKSTLDSIKYSDVILHIVDVSRTSYQEDITVTQSILDEIGVENEKRIYVFNKIDLAENLELIKKANIYFDGNVTSRTFIDIDGSKKSLGIMMVGFICTKITNKMIDDCIKAADEVMKGLK